MKLEIQSNKNTTFRQLKSLLSSQGIQEEGLALIFGEKAIQDTLERGDATAEALILTKKMESAISAPKIYEMAPSLFKELDVFGTQSPIALIKVPLIKDVSEKTKLEGCTLVIPFQDPHNVG